MSLTHKVVIPKFVAEAIEESGVMRQSVDYVMYELMNEESYNVASWVRENGNLVKLAQAIENGYEVEKTTDELIAAHYASFGGSPSAMERKVGMVDVLEILGIKIEGVNA